LKINLNVTHIKINVQNVQNDDGISYVSNELL
jgi:hypothetical protein